MSVLDGGRMRYSRRDIIVDSGAVVSGNIARAGNLWPAAAAIADFVTGVVSDSLESEALNEDSITAIVKLNNCHNPRYTFNSTLR